MDNKIITQIDTNLISVQHGLVNEENIARNELAIKELLHSVRNNEQYVNYQDADKLTEYQDLKKITDKLVEDLQAKDVYDLQTLIPQLADTCKDQVQQIYQLELQIAELTQKSEMYKRKYEGQKNRKIVRFIDKVAR